MRAQHKVREDGPWPIRVRGSRSGDDGGDTAQHLRTHKGEDDRSADEGACNGRAGPRHPEAHAGRSPQHLAPTRRTEADGEDGQDPGVAAREDGEAPEKDSPDADKEGGNQERDSPRGRVLAGPEVLPAPAQRRGEEIVLDNYCYEKPLGRDSVGGRCLFFGKIDLRL
ncbi:MAG: hypothetical protein Q9191_001967 [Dirinaria sp. TL-2023a]